MVSFKVLWAQEVPDHARCKNHSCGSCPLRPPTPGGWYGMNRGGHSAPSTAKILPQDAKTTPTSPGSASALPGDVAGARAQICAHFRWRAPLGSLKIAGELQGGETRAVHAYPKRACAQ